MPQLPHQLDPEEERIDHAPPSKLEVENVSVMRGRGPRPVGGGVYSATSCDDIGFLRFALVPPRDDRTPPEKMGVEMRLVSGTLPDGFRLPEKALRLSERFGLGVHWSDGATDDQDTIDFTVVLVAVDLAGNRSEPSALIHVTNP